MSDEDDEEDDDEENRNNFIDTSSKDNINNDRNYYGTSNYNNRRPSSKSRNPSNTISEKSKGFWNTKGNSASKSIIDWILLLGLLLI